jgi:hypothetical protein
MHSKTKLVVIGLVLAGLLAWTSGCGGGSSTTASLTKKQYLKQAQEICEKGEREQLELAAQYLKKHPGSEEEDMISSAGIPPLQKQIEKLKALPAPEGDEAKIEAFIKASEEALKEGEANPQDLLNSRSNPFDKPNELGKEYGFTNCASSP